MSRINEKIQHLLLSIDELSIFFKILLEVALALVLACVPFVLEKIQINADFAYPLYGFCSMIILILVLLFCILIFPKYHKSMKLIASDIRNGIRVEKYNHILITQHSLCLNLYLDKINQEHELKCNVVEHKNIYNNFEKNTYQNHVYNMSSSQNLSDISAGIKFYRNGETLHIDDERKTTAVSQQSVNGTVISEKSFHIMVPVNIPPQDSVILEICEEDCPAFSKTFEAFSRFQDSITDWISTMIYYPTEQFSLSIHLDKEVFKKYSLVKLANYSYSPKGIDALKISTSENYLILDQSDQRIVGYEELMRKWNVTPHITHGNLLKWEIHNPKVGCRYIMFFTLEKKQVG